MAKKLILLFSHKLTKVQIQDAKNSLDITDFVTLPKELLDLWSNIPPEINDLSAYLNPIKSWLLDVVNPNDYLLIQGDFGATYILINWAFKNNLIPIYSTTKRIHIENELEDGSVEIQKSFQHQIFRKYETYTINFLL